MGCCNKRRALLLPGPASDGAVGPGAPPASPLASPPWQGPPGPDVPMRLVGSERVRVEGAMSGRIYRASPAQRQISVCPLDQRALVRSGLFIEA